MGLCPYLALAAKTDRHGREHPGNARRGEEQGLHERLCCTTAVECNGAEVPDDGLAASKIGRRYKQQPTFGRLRCYGGDHGIVGIALDQPLERLAAVDTRSEYRAEAARLQQSFRLAGREDR